MLHNTNIAHREYDGPAFDVEIKWPEEIDFGYYHGMFGFVGRDGKITYREPINPVLKEYLKNLTTL